jgi:hypothetical protein
MPHSQHTLEGQTTDAWNNYWKYVGLSTGTPSATSPGTELTGGAYAREESTAGTPTFASGVASNQASAVTVNVPAGASPSNFVGFDAATAGNFAGYDSFTAIPFGSAGTLEITPTIQQQ